MAPVPLPPRFTADLFRPLNEELVALLRGLSPDEWHLPTLSRRWRVREVVAHLLDTHCRRLSFERDGLAPLAPGRPIESDGDLVAFLDDVNARWIAAAERLSPRLLTDLLEAAGRWLADSLASLDPFAPALFPVAWAGESESRCWFDVARELTEQWHHQQQIRLATGRPLLLERRFSLPVLETFLRAAPLAYRGVQAPEGTAVAVELAAPTQAVYSLLVHGGAWRLLAGEADGWAARVTLDPETAWRVLTRSLEAEEARARVRIEGAAELALPLLDTRAMMV